MQKLILIGKIEGFFEGEKPITYIKDAKFIIVSTDGINLQIIIHIPEPPYEYHAQAVKKFMDDNGYTEIYCYGGGKIVLGNTPDILFHSKSYAFGTANNETINKVAGEIWPGYEVEIMTTGTKVTEGRIYPKENIQHLVDNP